MTIERRLVLALFLLASAASAAEADKPGGKRICVPSEDGRSWVCGTADSPPPERGLPAVLDQAPSPEPPPFLADPYAGSATEAAAEVSAPAAVAPVTEPTPATPEPLVEEPAAAVAEEPAPEESPALDVVGADSAEAGTPRLLAAPREQSAFPLATEPTPTPAEAAAPEPAVAEPVASEPVVEEPVVEEPVVEEPIVAEPVVAEPVVEEPLATEPVVADSASTVPVAPEPAPVAPQALATPPGNTAAFLAQPATHYTLQIARATAQSGFSAQLGELGLRGEEAWAVPLSGGSATSWMLLWGTFPDLDAARAAAAGLAPRVAAWPRRIAPIQEELRAAGTR